MDQRFGRFRLLPVPVFCWVWKSFGSLWRLHRGPLADLRAYIVSPLRAVISAALLFPPDNRPLAKLDQAVKITDTSNQRKAKCETVSAVGIGFREDTEPFNKAGSVFNKDTLL